VPAPLGHYSEAMEDVGQDGAARAWIALESGDLASVERFALSADLNSWIACWARAWMLIAAGRTRHAIEICSSALRMEPGNAQLESALAAAYVVDRQRQKAPAILSDARWRPASFAIPVWAAAGETDLVFSAAHDALSRRDPGLDTALRLPVVQPLRRDPRYAAVLRSLDLCLH
jgi:hypothetical protein